MKTLQRTIYITQPDMNKLRALIDSMKSGREDLQRLRGELDQARVVASAEIPGDVITMNSKAQIRDLEDGELMEYTLVFPAKANVDAGLISVLAPVGTAMLGHREGDEFEWDVPAGTMRFRVEKVLYQPEAAGNYNG